MKILITGATGLVGKELVKVLLSQGHSIHYLTTSKNKIKSEKNYIGFFWYPEFGIIDENAFFEVDAIIHLAGASISKRWTNSYKEEIIESRVLSSNLLYNVLRKKPNQVKQMISASAIGIYPDNLTKVYAEESKDIANGFLGKVIVKWEESVDKFSQLNIKVCKLRTGLVLSKKGGVLAEMIKPIQLGIGSAFGSGKQIQSWIHMEDMVNMYVFALEKNLEGVFNAVAPNPITNQELVKVIAKIIHKPLFMPNIPKFILKLVLGEMHEILFESQNVSAKKIESNGFVFKYTDINGAVKNILNKKNDSV